MKTLFLRKAGVVTLILGKEISEQRKSLQAKKGQYIMIKSQSTLRHNISKCNLKIIASKHVKQKLTQLDIQIDKSTLIIRYFSIPLSKVLHKISKN